MANRNRGEVSFKANGGTYTLRYDANTLCDLEDAFDMGIAKVGAMFEDAESLRLSHVRLAFCLGLREHHPDMDEREAGRLISELGMDAALEQFSRAFEAAFPQPEDDARPPKAGQNSTGSPS